MNNRSIFKDNASSFYHMRILIYYISDVIVYIACSDIELSKDNDELEGLSRRDLEDIVYARNKSIDCSSLDISLVNYFVDSVISMSRSKRSFRDFDKQFTDFVDEINKRRNDNHDT